MTTVTNQGLANLQQVSTRPNPQSDSIKRKESISSTDTITSTGEVARQNISSGGKSVPGVNHSPAFGSEELNQAVSEINKYVQNVQRDLEFSVDDEVGRIVIKVIDSESKEIIRQIPPETILEVAKTLKETSEGNLLQVKV